MLKNCVKKANYSKVKNQLDTLKRRGYKPRQRCGGLFRCATVYIFFDFSIKQFTVVPPIGREKMLDDLYSVDLLDSAP